MGAARQVDHGWWAQDGSQNGKVVMLGRLNVVAVAVLMCSGVLHAENQDARVDADALSDRPTYLSDGDERSDIHGYMETQLKTAHITPRGLIIADHGVEIQPVGALTFNLLDRPEFIDKVSATVGVWNSVNSSLHDPVAGPWFEIDYFARVNCQIADRVNVAVQYVAFDSPGGAFSTDNNLEVTLGYDDLGMLAHDFAIRPYTRFFYNMSGSSTTLLGRNGNTFDVELGFAPTYVCKAIANYPITFSLPTYLTVGPKNFWGGTSNVGIATTTLAASIPMSFIPARFGRWHWDAGISYFNLLNGKLVDAADKLGNGRDRSRIVGVLGVGMDF